MFRQRSEKHRFACIPASSAAKNEIRYKEFAAMVCRLTGAINAYDHIHVEGERLAVHEKFDQKKLQLVQVIEFDKEFSKARRCFASTTFSPKAFPMPALPFSWRNWEPKSWAASLSERRSSKCNHHPSLSPLCSRGLKIKIGSAPPGADSLPSPGHFLILSTSFSQAVFLHRDASAEHSPKSDHSPSHQVDGQFFCLFLVSG